ncbi:NB-ARC domain-containing protein [Coleofasciculus sp.]|uniref:NB-ARC domain-containing protein n=1 Tax=Coleofasciculus sp. TaxID=3100458 RepID=UPI0039F972EA
MDVQEVLNWTDNLVFSKTGKHLDSLQKAVVEGTWQRQKYPEIARNCNRTHDRIKQVARELWQLISAELGEDVRQSNFRAILEQVEFSNVLYFGSGDGVKIGDIKFCKGDCPNPTAKNRSRPSNATSTQPEKRHDLTEAPECDRVYNRTTELTTLKQWILQEKIRIVTIFGLPGIGKTTLARELVEQIKDNFDYILWCNCTETLTLKCLQTNLIQFFPQDRETKLPSLIDYLRSHPCLIIIDDLQELFTPGELAGTYLPDCENYSKFWQQMARTPHHSCFLLISWEKPTEIASLEGENRHCRTLKLGGLADSAAELLTDKGLTDEDKWLELIKRYGGNPSWLNIIASTIQDLFNGSVHRFLSYPSLFLGDLEPRLQAQYQQLSESEKMVMLWLAHQNAADISHKPAELALSDSDFLKAVQSLRKRGLIEKITDNGESLFAVQALVKAYVKEI